MFKEVGYEKAIMERKAVAKKPYKDDPAPPHQDPGSRSQSVPYFLMGHKIAVCHQYTRPDGSIGASGKPDPKMLEYQGLRLYTHSTKCNCKVCSGPPEKWKDVFAQMKKQK